jgi:hypothetical protein
MNRSYKKWTEATKSEQKLQQVNRSYKKWTEGTKSEQKLQKVNRSYKKWTEATKSEQKLQKVNRSYKNIVMTFDNYQMNQCQWSEPTSVPLRMAGPQPKHV